MRVLSLDISSSTGWALLDSGCPNQPVELGVVQLTKTAKQYAAHPFGYVLAAQDMAQRLLYVIDKIQPDMIVIEETNGSGRSFWYFGVASG